MAPKDLFSGHASAYAAFRPRYPAGMVRHLSRLVPYRGVAWDCACGSGQMSLPLAQHFQLVMATDISEQQIAGAPAHKGILYTVQPAEKTDFPDAYFDMIVVAQAVHWFHFEAFYREVSRVLAPGGVLVLLGYGLMEVSPETDRVVQRLYRDIAGAYWEPERRWVEDNYRSIPFPFEEIPVPPFEMTQEWTLDHLTGYLNTWSAVKACEKHTGINPVLTVHNDLREAWGTATTKTIRFPLFFRVGRYSG